MNQAMRDDMMDYITTADYDQTGGLYSILNKHPQVLDEFDKFMFIQTPSHQAAASGKTRLAIETLNLMPSFGRKLNTQGLTPLHLAVTKNYPKTAIVIVQFDRQLVRVKGKDGNTPLHYAAAYCVKGSREDLDVLANFLLECPDAIDDLNNQRQSAVHLVMLSQNCEAVRLVLNWVVRMAKETVLRRRDDDGNTPLHMAVQCGCEEGVKILVKTVKINKRNLDSKTPLDVALDCKNATMEQILIKAGAKKGRNLILPTTEADYLLSPTNILETSLRGFCFMLKDLTLDMRNVVLVVAVLIATATYQAVLQPPGGVSSQDEVAAGGKSSAAGKMLMGKKDYDYFMPTTTMAFTLSVVMIIFVLNGRPYNLILHGCLIFLALSYLSAMKSVSPTEEEADAQLTFILSWITIVAAFSLKMFYFIVKSLFEDAWWLPDCRVVASNFWDRVADKSTQARLTFFEKLRMQCKLMLPSDKYY